MKYPIPTVHYGSNDIFGNFSANWITNNEFTIYAKKIGIDTNKYRPLAIQYNHSNDQDLAIFAVCMDTITSEGDSIHSWAMKHEGTLPIVKFVIQPDLLDLFKRIDNFTMIASEHWADVHGFDELDEVILK